MCFLSRLGLQGKHVHVTGVSINDYESITLAGKSTGLIAMSDYVIGVDKVAKLIRLLARVSPRPPCRLTRELCSNAAGAVRILGHMSEQMLSAQCLSLQIAAAAVV